jgi:adenosylcobinamide kinase / adenosylcobinamide-phosphate guanylyltransferase
MLTLVLGGARSGKSRYAQSLCVGVRSVVYIATARADDEEMIARIARHQSDRPAEWITRVEHDDVPGAIRDADPRDAVILVDCVTVWLSNVCWKHRSLDTASLERLVLDATSELVAVSRERTVIAVSNELGQGVVPESSVGRTFRDLHGVVNQALARGSDAVVLMVAGLPLSLKGAIIPPSTLDGSNVPRSDEKRN